MPTDLNKNLICFVISGAQGIYSKVRLGRPLRSSSLGARVQSPQIITNLRHSMRPNPSFLINTLLHRRVHLLLLPRLQSTQ